MKTTLAVVFFLTSFFIRSLRWLGILQQKEYRSDRILLFLLSSEGVQELLRFFPQKSDFSRSGLKRPKLTPRSILLTLIFVVLTVIYFQVGISAGQSYLLNWYPYPFWYTFLMVLAVMAVYLICIPLFAILSIVPTALLAYVQTYKRLFQAGKVLRTHKPIVIGITGSYGKTSTKMLLTHVLEKKYSVFMTPKSYNTKYSVANSVVTGYKGEEIAIIEYAAYKKGEIRELTKWIQPQLALITGLTKQHVGLFGSLKEIISAKAELVASLPEKATVICNVYDEKTKQIFDEGSVENKAKLIAVNAEYEKVKIEKVRLNAEGRLQFEWNGTIVKTQLVGGQYIEALHMVIVTAQHFKMEQEEIISALESFVPDEKFVFTYSLNNGVRVIDDGDTSNPKGFAAIIVLAKSMSAAKKILITPGIVDLGNDSKDIHLELARQAQRVFDQVVFVGESGKQEFMQVFGSELLTQSEQLEEVVSHLDSNDLIIIEGRMPSWTKKYIQ